MTSTLKLLIITSAFSCAHIVPNVRFYAEIPFKDCPEGVFVESVTKKTGFVSCEKWTEIRPFMVMVDPEGKKEIFNFWSEGCRNAGEKCIMQMQSVRSVLDTIDRITEAVVKGK